MAFKFLAVNATWSLIAHLLGRGSIVVASIILARHLKTVEFAAYSYFQLTASMLAAYAAMGLGVTASRFLAEANKEHGDQVPPVVTLWLLSGTAGLTMSTGILAIPPDWFNGGFDFPRWLVSLSVLVTVLGVVPAGGIIGLERYRDATFVSAASAVVMVLGAGVAAKAESAAVGMWAFVMASLVQTLGNSFVLARRMGPGALVRSARFGRREFKSIVGFAGPMTAVSLLSASGSWIVGRIILGGPSGTTGFSLYVIGLQWFSLALLLPGMISHVIFPRLIRERFEIQRELSSKASVVLVHGVAMALGTSLATCTAAALLSPLLWSMYGMPFDLGAWLIIAFMVAAVPAAPANTLGNAILADDGQLHWLAITIAWFFCLIITAVVSAPLGVWSGPVSHGAAYLLMISLAVQVAHQRALIRSPVSSGDC